MTKKELSRRDFLKIAGLSGVVAIPGLVGAKLVIDSQGEAPPSLDPYAEQDFITSWPDGPEEAAPILVLITDRKDNPFGVFLAEILRAEGLNAFQVADVAMLDQAPLELYDAVLLAEGRIDQTQFDTLAAYAANGGSLIIMRPGGHMVSLCGLEKLGGELSEAYIMVDTDHPLGEQQPYKTLQYHSSAAQYQLAGAKAIAWLSHDGNVQSQFPGITLHTYGNGMVAAWAFDLAKSTAYTRQGNPEWANQDRDGHIFIRAADMFKDWIDLDRMIIPQADEQQRIFASVLIAMTQGKKPLPRLWYLPGSANAVLIATGDAHPISDARTIEDVLMRVERRGGHMSIYYSFVLHEQLYRVARKARFWATELPVVGDTLARRYGSPTPDQVHYWRARGHEFALHPHVGTDICGGFSPDGFIEFTDIEEGWQRYWSEFTGLGYGPVPPTVRTHCVLWQGWVETARLQAGYGMRMNVDYYHVGPAFRKDNGEWAYGHFTGSGLPMKFVDEQGRVLEIYQQLTQLADEHFFNFPEINWVNVADYSAEAALEVSQGLLQASLDNATPAAFCVNFHPDPFAYGGRLAEIAGSWLEGTLDYATDHNIPIWSALDWLRFTRARQNASVHTLRWGDQSKQLEFQIDIPPEQTNALTVMLPENHGAGRISQIELNGDPMSDNAGQIHGIQYRTINIFPGSHKVSVQYA